MAGDEPIIYISGKRFKDVTDQTTSNQIYTIKDAEEMINGKSVSTNR